MTTLYRRTWKMTFYDENEQIIFVIQDNLETTNAIRITFFIRQMIYIVNYMAQFSIYNLSESTRQVLLDATSITFECGYADNLKLLHKGNIVNMFDLREQPEYKILITSQDFLSNLEPTIDTANPSETDREVVVRVMSKIAPQLVINSDKVTGNLRGLTDKPIGHKIEFNQLNYKAVSKKLTTSLGINMWVTNGVLYTSSKSPSSITPTSAQLITLNYKNGMISSPQIDLANSGITVKSLINPELLPGNFVKVETLAPQIQFGGVNYLGFNQQQATRGTWEIFTVDHVGDSRGEEWYSNVSAFGANILGK